MRVRRVVCSNSTKGLVSSKYWSFPLWGKEQGEEEERSYKVKDKDKP